MEIRVRINKTVGDFKLNIDFQSTSGRIGILGASGCGKSMTLKCIAGIETPDEGEIYVGDEALFDSEKNINMKPQKRRIGYLFQNYALFPAMTVAENIECGLSGRKEEKKQRVNEMIEKFQLWGLENRLPKELSGGQQQRVALARIMAYRPDVILLDEPFSALDVYLKDQLQQEMMELFADYPGIVIMVSHSRDEIYRFSDELLIIDQGQNVICGKTKDIFENPVYQEAARLTGCKNFSEIEIVDHHTIKIVDWGILVRTKEEVPDGVTCIGYRAHDFLPVWGERPENGFAVQVMDVAQLPFETNYYLKPEKQETKNPICWFVQREILPEIEEKGVPDYLMIQEERLMFLKDNFGKKGYNGC